MAKMKYDMQELEEVTSKAALHAAGDKEKKKLKDMLVRGIPVDLYNTLKENGHNFGSYAKVAVQEKMKRDGLI